MYINIYMVAPPQDLYPLRSALWFSYKNDEYSCLKTSIMLGNSLWSPNRLAITFPNLHCTGMAYVYEILFSTVINLPAVFCGRFGMTNMFRCISPMFRVDSLIHVIIDHIKPTIRQHTNEETNGANKYTSKQYRNNNCPCDTNFPRGIQADGLRRS